MTRALAILLAAISGTCLAIAYAMSTYEHGERE